MVWGGRLPIDVGDGSSTIEHLQAERASPGAAFLEVVAGAPLGATPLGDGVVLGRDVRCEARFTVAGVSRKHARVHRDANGDITLVDLDSRNGTFLNGRKVRMAVLRGGDEIRVGPVVLRLRFAGEDDGAVPHPQADPLSKLSGREREVAALTADGLTNGEIGERLGISAGTVGRHLANIYKRLGIHSRAALAALAAKNR